MPVNDLRDWIARIDALGQVRRVNGAECDEEIGAITDLYMERVGRPALLFDEIPGYPPGFRVLANVTTSPQRVAVTLGIPRDLSLAGMVQHCRRFHGALPGIKPRVADSGPLQENVATGADIDMLRFPTPKWHEDDGGRYLGTGCAVVMQDPDSDWINVGCYRVMVHDRNTLGIMITAGKQGRLIMEKYWRRNEACPVAVSFGHDPLIYLMAGLHAGAGVCEYDVAGGIRGEPVDVIRGEVTNLPLPATAEIAIEGHIPPGRYEPEGPFGEWTGYYAGGREKQPVIEVASLMYRNDPIILGTVPRKPPSDDTYISSFLSSSAIWEQMEAAGVPGIKGVWNHEGSGSQMFITVAIEQMYAGPFQAGRHGRRRLLRGIVPEQDGRGGGRRHRSHQHRRRGVGHVHAAGPGHGLGHRAQLLEQPPGSDGLPGRPQELQQENAHRRLQALEPTGYLSQGGGGERRWPVKERIRNFCCDGPISGTSAPPGIGPQAGAVLDPLPRMGCIERTERTTWLMTIA